MTATRNTLALIAFLASFGPRAFASAQSYEALPAAPGAALDSTPPSERWRVELEVPAFGLAHPGDITQVPGPTMGGGVRFVFEGNGAFAQMLGAMGFSWTCIFGSCDPWDEVMLDAGYLHRFELEGDAERGLAIDITPGVTTGTFDNELVVGGNLGVALGGHAGPFGLMLEYRGRLIDVTWTSTQHENMLVARISIGVWGT